MERSESQEDTSHPCLYPGLPTPTTFLIYPLVSFRFLSRVGHTHETFIVDNKSRLPTKGEGCTEGSSVPKSRWGVHGNGSRVGVLYVSSCPSAHVVSGESEKNKQILLLRLR